MIYESIRGATNGYILTDKIGNETIAKSLFEAAQLSGEPIVLPGSTIYAQHGGSGDLEYIKKLAAARDKIAAIKALRDIFSPRLGLREAKDIVECFLSPPKNY
jgi:ribosomal protein L7/L12